MQLDQKKITRGAKTGVLLDTPMLLVMLAALFGAAITNVIEAFSPFNMTLYIVLTCVFVGCALIAFILFLIGARCRKRVLKQVFEYCEYTTGTAINQWTESDSVALSINLSEDPNTAVFTVTDEKGTAAVYDLTCAMKLSVSASIFVASCVCGVAARVKENLGKGQNYRRVSYKINAADNPAEQYFIKNGTADEKELTTAVNQYQKTAKKYGAKQ